MPTAAFRRPRALSRFFGLLLAVLCTSGQIALTVHNHPLSLRRDGRASFSQHSEIGGESVCQLCAMSVQSRVAHTPALALAAAQTVVCAVVDAPAASFGRAPALRASSRAPPTA
jgi:hypothetical protein